MTMKIGMSYDECINVNLDEEIIESLQYNITNWTDFMPTDKCQSLLQIINEQYYLYKMDHT